MTFVVAGCVDCAEAAALTRSSPARRKEVEVFIYFAGQIRGKRQMSDFVLTGPNNSYSDQRDFFRKGRRPLNEGIEVR